MQDRFNVKVSKTMFYEDTCVHTHARIIVPDRLPVKLTVYGKRVIVNVGEFAIIPPHILYSINTSPERFVIDFDFKEIIDNRELASVYPIISLPCIYHPVFISRDGSFRYSGYTTWFIPDFLENDERNSVNEDGETGALKSDENSLLAKYRLAPKAEPGVIISGNGYSPYELVQCIIDIFTGAKPPFVSTISYHHILNLYTTLAGEIVCSGFNNEQLEEEHVKILNNLGNSISYMQQNIDKHITLDMAAAQAGYNKAHFSRLFKDFYGFGVYDYILFIRVRNACILLSSTDLGASEIAAASGFTSSSTFNRVFKLHTGYSPREYRKVSNNN